MWVLQWYIFRDLLKAMVLTTIGMTLVFTLGGGVANMIKGISISSVELLQLLGFFLPVATTLTLPVAALLSTTNVYGRLSADNEFVACRASGINMHRLLLSAAIIALGVGAFTFYFSNYVIPRFIHKIDSSVRQSIDKMVYRKLKMNKFIKVQNYVFHADAVQHIQTEGDAGRKDYLRIAGAAFIELKDGDAARFGTAPEAVIEFDKTGRLPLVRVLLKNTSMFDRTRLQYMHLTEQAFALVVPLPSKMKPKWLDLPDLLHYVDSPEELPEITGLLRDIRRQIVRESCYSGIFESLKNGRDWQAGDKKVTYTIKAGCFIQRSSDEDGTPLFKDVTIVEESSEGLSTLKAGRGSVRASRSFGLNVPSLNIVLQDGVSVLREGEPKTEKIKVDLASVPVPDRYLRAADRTIEQMREDPGKPLFLGERVAEAREYFNRELDGQVRAIIGIIHARAAFSISCFALIILGAGLGIILRGGQAMVSFGISCIPFALVVVTIVMGRQMAQNEGTEIVGLAILWTGIGLVVLADILILFKWLRR